MINIKRDIIRILFCWILFVLLSLFSSEIHALNHTPASKIMLRADKCKELLLRSKKKRRYRHYWNRCISRYLLIRRYFPKSPEAPWALYKAARLQERLYRYSGLKKDLQKAIELYEGLVKAYPSHRLSDDALFNIGKIYYRRYRDIPKAYLYFSKISKRYPKGDMAPRARSMIRKLSPFIKKVRAEKARKIPPKRRVIFRDIRHWSTANYTRVVIDLSGSTYYEAHTLPEDPKRGLPKRVYVDIKGARLLKRFKGSIPIKGALLKRARVGQFTKDTVRVVLDINSIERYQVFHLNDPFRIVVDVQGRGVVRKEIKGKKLTLAQQLGLSVKKIVLDPGHGGRDPGCYINRYIKEKDITLRIAKILKRYLEERLNCKVLLTREDDRYLSLEQRTAFANMNKADLFISIHVNSYKKDRRVHGIETYFLNITTDERAMMVAARENAASEKNLSDLQKILNDMLLNTKINESSRLAREVQYHMIHALKGRYGWIRSLGVKQAPFYVLIGAQMPAILLEVGFITNPKEREYLQDDDYIALLSKGIVSGVDSYIRSIVFGG